MTWTKTKTAIVVGMVLVAGLIPFLVKQIKAHRASRWEVRDPSVDLLRKTTPQVRIVPTKFQSSRWENDHGRMLGIAQPAKIVVAAAYGMWAWRSVFEAPLPPGRFDVIANLPQNSAEALRQEVKKQFGVVAHRETRESDVLLLRIKNPAAGGLKPASPSSRPGTKHESGAYSWTSRPFNEVVGMLGFYFEKPIIDQTGFTGLYDYQLKVDWKHHNADTLKQDLLDQLGLELVPGRQPIEVLVVEKAPSTIDGESARPQAPILWRFKCVVGIAPVLTGRFHRRPPAALASVSSCSASGSERPPRCQHQG